MGVLLWLANVLTAPLWITARLIRRAQTARRLRGRLLFRFWDGRQDRYVDPLATWRAIRTWPEFDATDPLKLGLVDAGAEPETQQFLDMTAAVFGVARFDGRTQRGLTDVELMGLFSAFTQYLEALKKNTSPPPTSPSPTAASCSAATPDCAPITNCSAASP